MLFQAKTLLQTYLGDIHIVCRIRIVISRKVQFMFELKCPISQFRQVSKMPNFVLDSNIAKIIN